MYYKDVPETGNIDLILDDEKEIVVVNNIDMVTVAVAAALVFSIEDGVYTITNAAFTAAIFEAGDTIIIRDSVQDAAGEVPAINNDGLYTIVTSPAGSITVLEPVIAATSTATDASVDEYATFILHPTKPTMQICIYIDAVTDPATFEVSFRPGGYWAAKIEKGLPEMQGSGVADKKYLIQVETAPYLQTEEEMLDIDGVEANDVNKKGTLLMRVFAGKGIALTDGIGVALVQLS